VIDFLASGWYDQNQSTFCIFQHMLTLSVNDLYSLEDNRALQECVVQAEALDFSIDIHDLGHMIDEYLTALQESDEDSEWNENNADEWMAAIFSPKLAFLSNLLSQNNRLNSLELDFYYGWVMANYIYAPDYIMKGLFQGLGSIPKPVDKLSLNIGPFDSDPIRGIKGIFIDKDGVKKSIGNIIKTQPVFQQIKQLELEEAADGYGSGVSELCGNLFGWFFEAIPNKERIESLSLKLRSGKRSNEMLLQQVIDKCNQLSSLSLDTNYLDDDLYTRMGNFIQSHPTMHSFFIESAYAIRSVQFLINALDNKRLIDVSLTVCCELEDEIGCLANKIKCLAGLVRLKLIALVDTDHEAGLPLVLLRSIADNPTLSDLTFRINNIDVTPMAKEALAKNKKLRSIQLYKSFYGQPIQNSFFSQLTQRNGQLADTYKPFFALNTEANLSGVKLIEMNSIWLSIMASYRLTPPENQILAKFQNNYFMLVLDQFFTQISHAKLQRLPTDVCHVIAEYTDMYSITKLNAVTGGYFFRQVKPLTTDNEAYSNESSLSSV